MTIPTPAIATLNFYPNKNPKMRFFALWYFTILLMVWTILGHLYLGFEQSYAHPFVGVAAAISAQFFLEFVDAKANGRRPRYEGGLTNCLNMLPPAIIPGLACAMLLYPNSRLMPVIFAAVLSVASKVILRAPVGNGQFHHFFNPSNFGITATLLLMPSTVGMAPPYMFTENVTGVWNWVISAVILSTGIFIHGKFTGRLPLVLAWLSGFVAQALIRAAIFHIPIRVPFIPMSSAAFILFTLYMIPDPATTPIKPVRQVAFGFSIAAIYAFLFVSHVVFGLFIALALTSAVRGISLYVSAMSHAKSASASAPVSITPITPIAVR